MSKKTVKDLRGFEGTHVFVRVDYNVPLEDGRITDETRIRASLPTLEYLIKGGARLALASHLGRPKKGPTPDLSLRPVAVRLGELLHREVKVASDCVGDDVRKRSEALKDGGVLLLENVRFHPEEEQNDPRFHPEEEKNDPAFARRLVEDTRSTVFVNDAFGSAHRAHASTEGVAHHVKRALAGLLMEKEIRYLDMAVHPRERPLVAVLGGAKVSDKIQVIEALLERVDALLVGGGMAYTFFRAKGYPTGKSLVEEDKVPLAAELFKKGTGKIVLPVDHVVASKFAADTEHRELPAQEVPEGWMGLDIGPITRRAYAERLRAAKVVVWNGPMGVFEMKPFAEGTLAIARAMADSKAVTIVGGGDSVAAVTQMGLADKIDHVSTGGGASLEFLAGETLPGVACLEDVSA